MKILGARYYLAPSIIDGDSIPASTYRDGQEVDVKILDKKHPVVKGLEDFHLHEEVYGQYRVIPDVHPLISSNHPESDELQVWTNTYGKSRIVYIQFGHDNNAYSNPNFRKLLRQAITWVGE
jgi:type 1 glutamine amidotransferase